MKNDFVGVIVEEESLENRDVLKKIKITNTEIENVTDRHKTPWLTKWTMDTVEIPEKQAEYIARELSDSLDSKHNWYTDFKNANYHYIIFHRRIFYINRKSKEQYHEATKYGISLGIPEYQLDFSPYIKGSER